MIVEVAWSGHLDPLGLAPMLGAVALAGAAGPAWRAGALLGIGGSMKFAPLVAVPALGRLRGRRIRAAAHAGAVALEVPTVLYLPYAAAGASLFSGLRTYADIWAFNAGLYRGLELLPGHPDLPRWIGAAVVGGLAIHAALRRWTLDRALFWTIGSALLLSPTLHPWYVLWVLPFAALRRNRAWILLSGLVFVTYWGLGPYLESGEWPRPLWSRLLLWLPFYGLLLRDAAGLGAAKPQPTDA